MCIKQRIVCVSIVILSVVIYVVLAFAGYYFLTRPAPVYETNDVSDYGIIKGNYDNKRPKEFIFSFFPERVEDNFSDVIYHYKAKKLDTYAYEIYLEFVIQDAEEYTTYLSNVIGDNATEPFHFDSNYQIYYISNYLWLSPASTIIKEDNTKKSIVKKDYTKPPVIGNAKIGAVLFSDAEQRIIFFALGEYDGGGTNTDELNYFFNRFGINPWVYQSKATKGIAS